MSAVLQDLRYAARIFSRRPGFAIVAVLAIALGISSSTAVFSMVNAVLLRSLPLAHFDRLVMLWHEDLPSGRDRITLSPAELREYAAGQQSFDAIAALRGLSMNVTVGEAPIAAEGAQVTSNILDALGIAPAMGRGFGTAGNQEALVSYEFWQRALGADVNILGRALTIRAGFASTTPGAHPIDGSYTVVGVLPSGLRLPYRAAEIWIPLPPDEATSTATGLLVFARLRAGMTLEQASAEVAATTRRLFAERPEGRVALTSWLITLRREDTGDISPTLVLLSLSVGLLCLIVCANVGNMLLSRLTERQRELAVRRALGAGRARLVRQLLTESTVLAMGGALVGILLALWMTQALALVGPATIPRLTEIGVDGRALAVALGAAVAMSLVFGVAPALKLSRSAGTSHLAERMGNVGAVGRLRDVLVMAECALAFVVLVGAGLVLTSARRLESAAVGYDPRNVLTFRVSLPQAAYGAPERREAFFGTLLERVRALPAVTSAGAVNILPQMGMSRSVELDGATTVARPMVSLRIATPGYFETLGVRVLAGRDFRSADVPSGAVIVSRSMAERLWSNTETLDRRVRLLFPTAATPWLPIVGIVEDVRQWINSPGEPTIYWLDLRQPAYAFAVRAAADPAMLTAAIGAAVRELDPNQPIFDVQSMQERLRRSQELTYERFRTTIMGGFGIAALLLAGLGIYGVVRYASVQRAPEFAIRMALGASPRQLVTMVVSQSLRSVIIGAAIGIVASAALGRVLSSTLYGSAGAEPMVIVAVAILLGGLAFVAALGPARRAGRADPIRALRGE